MRNGGDEECLTCGGLGLASDKERETYCLDCEEGNYLRLEDERLELAAEEEEARELAAHAYDDAAEGAYEDARYVGGAL